MILVFIFIENYLKCDAIHDFLIWPRTGSNPADINGFQSHTEKKNIFYDLPKLESTATSTKMALLEYYPLNLNQN